VFGIHGLWPDYNDGSWPQFCDKEPFNPKEVSDVIIEMDDDWGSLACPSSDSHSFWKHEWTKHGTCSGLGQRGYFQAAINLYSKYDVTAALAEAGIHPDGKHYEIEHVRKAISTVLDGHLPGIDCNKDAKGNRQIYQVWICVAKNGSTLIQCPVFPRTECKGSVEFPAFDPSGHHRLISNGVNATAMKSST
jgi:ribonuclease T2